ncbi:MAG: hypothetical protein GEU79_02015 [Acidimicrobiia bacterium]|nr:hypothetical protein [Acidimicrobiia bacterium]
MKGEAPPVPADTPADDTPRAQEESSATEEDTPGVTISKPPSFEPSKPTTPSDQEPAAEETASEEPAEPAPEEPAPEEPAPEEPAADEPAAEEPAAEEPAAEEPAEPAAEQEPVEPAAAVAVAEAPAEEPPTDGQPNGTGNGRVAAIVDPRPVAPATGAPEGVRTQRLLTVVKARAIQNVKAEPTDKVNTWPHLMIAEFTALMAMTVLLLVMSIALAAPLLEPANFNVTPNPSKAPWYFLGLQELLSYFDAQIAGVTVPTIIGLVGFFLIPYVDRNPSTKPSQRKYATLLYSFFLAGAASLTIIGVLFRGEGFNFAYPWSDGIFFDDLKDWVHFEEGGAAGGEAGGAEGGGGAGGAE